jgi:5-methylcytosine-specific restriction protein A
MTYGPIGEGRIHVHHLRELAEVKQAHSINPIKDLRPVCPNCHMMLHSKRPALSIDELKKHLRNG